MANMNILDKNHPVTIGLIAVFVIGAIAAAAFGGVHIQGMAASAEVALDFPALVDGPNNPGWADNAGSITWAQIDLFCKAKGRAGAEPTGRHPFLIDMGQPTRYSWDGNTPMIPGTAVMAEGPALVAVMCLV